LASDLEIRVNDNGNHVTIQLPERFPDSNELAPIEVIDGQHRLWAFDDTAVDFDLPVVAFYGLDRSWQAYLFWTINIKPKRINVDCHHCLRHRTFGRVWKGGTMTRRQYPAAVKRQAEQLLATGMPVAQVAQALDAPEMTIWGWFYRAKREGRLAAIVATRGTPDSGDPTDPIVLTHRIRALEQRLAVMDEEMAILGKVSAFFAKQRQR
jgi:transposase-like protein